MGRVVLVVVGLCIAYLLWIRSLDAVSMQETLGFASRVGGLTRGTLHQGRFDSVSALLPHNLGVMAAVVVLCLTFGAGGAAAILGWNACVWMVSLSSLVFRTTSMHPEQAREIELVAFAAITPHLVLELLGYALACVAAMRARQAVARYRGGQRSIGLGRARGLLLTAAGVLVVAAAVEASFPNLVLTLLP